MLEKAGWTVCCCAMVLGCSGEPWDDISEIVENLRQAGYPDDEIMVVDDVVYVGRDAVVTLQASREMLEVDSTGGHEQYRTTNLVNAPRTICINAPTFTGVFSTGLDLAISNYNNAREVPFPIPAQRSISFTRGTTGCGATINAVLVPGTGGSAGFPSGGLPFGTINIGTGLASFTLDVIEHVITHELGHTIGLRHSDFFNRSISCGGSAINEEIPPTGLGAIHVPGTPTGAVVGGSVMNSCFRPTETGEFTASDVTTLNTLYPLLIDPGVI